MAGTARPAHVARALRLGLGAIVIVLGLTAFGGRASAADPAVAFMEKVAHELLLASRSRSPAVFAATIHRYADTSYIGSYSLGSYRQKLRAEDRPGYLSGMVRFIGRYAATEAPKYPVAGYKITGSLRGGQGIMVDSVITLRDGSSYDVRWLLSGTGSTFRVRDAMVFGFWMTPFLRRLFENYISENGGNVHALVAALSR
jgi:phospholipid transport system substrate-binding protein